MVPNKLPVPNSPAYLNNGRARAYCGTTVGAGGLVWIFFLSSIIFSSFSLSPGDGPT